MDHNPLSNCRPLYTLRFYQTKLLYLVALTRVLFQGALYMFPLPATNFKSCCQYLFSQATSLAIETSLIRSSSTTSYF